MKRREFIAGLGGAAAWPVVARAQQPTMPVVGLLSAASPQGYAANTVAVRRGLSELGFLEGRNLVMEFRWAEDHYDRLPALAADLVQRQVTLIVAGGLTAALAAKAATATIPIVFSAASDPVRAGLVTSLNRPGGNITGVAGFSDALISKRLEILRDLVPSAAVVGLLVNPSAASAEIQSRVVQTAAQTLGVQIRMLNVENQEQFDAVLTRAVRERIDAIIVPASTVFTNGRARLVASAALHAMPAIYEIPDFVTAGGLISYGSSRNAGADAAYHQVGVYAGRILKGERPADLPVAQPSKFELVINLKTAKALGLEIPPAVLALADKVIE